MQRQVHIYCRQMQSSRGVDNGKVAQRQTEAGSIEAGRGRKAQRG